MLYEVSKQLAPAKAIAKQNVLRIEKRSTVLLGSFFLTQLMNLLPSSPSIDNADADAGAEAEADCHWYFATV